MYFNEKIHNSVLGHGHDPSIYPHENTFVSVRMSLQTVLRYTQVDFRHIT
jgi:hypothetical protein